MPTPIELDSLENQSSLMKQTPNRRVIWDLPTRLFHWLLVTAFFLAWLTYDDNRFLYVHVFSGYVFLGLLVFRFVWGFIGTRYAKFVSFAHSWKTVTRYLISLLNGSAMRYIGHNPVGGWVIFFLLVLGLTVGITGILTLAGEEGHGIFRHFVNYKVGIVSRQIHELLAWVMLLSTAIHVSGVIVESFIHRSNLIWEMISGRKDVEEGVVGVRRHHIIGLSIVALIFSSALIYFRGYLEETADHLYLPYKGPTLPDNAKWREECGECHFAFHPTLLPKRSWEALFAQLDDHFGEEIDLDAETFAELKQFHLRYASESELTEPARKILYYTPKEALPLRITETHYWLHKHEDIDPVYWKNAPVNAKSNCASCHLDAQQGTYEDSDMRLPRLKTDFGEKK